MQAAYSCSCCAQGRTRECGVIINAHMDVCESSAAVGHNLKHPSSPQTWRHCRRAWRTWHIARDLHCCEGLHHQLHARGKRRSGLIAEHTSKVCVAAVTHKVRAYRACVRA